MPKIHIEIWPGRSEEHKDALAQELIEATAKSLGIPADRVTVEVEEIRK